MWWRALYVEMGAGGGGSSYYVHGVVLALSIATFIVVGPAMPHTAPSVVALQSRDIVNHYRHHPAQEVTVDAERERSSDRQIQDLTRHIPSLRPRDWILPMSSHCVMRAERPLPSPYGFRVELLAGSAVGIPSTASELHITPSKDCVVVTAIFGRREKWAHGVEQRNMPPSQRCSFVLFSNETAIVNDKPEAK